MGSTLLDETVTFAEFGRRHLDPRLAKAVTVTLGLDRPTLVQSQGIPVALEGKDLLCRARTGSGKTLCYGIPLVQRLLVDASSKGTAGPLGGLILVPSKELVVQVHGVITQLLAFSFDVLTAEPLLSGQKYAKAELPSILVTTPSALMALLNQKRGSMPPLAELLKVFVVDEADLMFSFGYEDDMRALCVLLPATYQAMLVSATLSEEVEQLKGLMLHKPVILKLEEPRVTGQLSQFYFVCKKGDKYLILYALLKLQLLQGKKLMFVKNIDSAYRMKIFLERFSINSAVLNAELTHSSRQNIIQAFNQGVVDLLIATDAGLIDDSPQESYDAQAEEEYDEEEEEEPPEPDPPVPKKKLKRRRAQEEETEIANEVHAEPEETVKKGKLKKKKKKVADGEVADAVNANETADDEEVPPKAKRKKKKHEEEAGAPITEEAVAPAASKAKKETEITVKTQKKFGKGSQQEADAAYSMTRGVDLYNVSTVINADVPLRVRDYVHRVGRCARGGASGTAFTLCEEEEQPILEELVRSQSEPGAMSPLRPLPMQISDVERFRYRVEDMAKGLKKKIVLKYLARELQLEALNCERLKEYFEENPEEKLALLERQRELKARQSVRANLKHVPSYLVPEELTGGTPVQDAIRKDQAARGGPITSQARRKQMRQQSERDPLQSVQPGINLNRKGKRKFITREMMLAKEKRMAKHNPDPEALPPISRKKIWALRHGKKVRKVTDVFGERKKLTKFQKGRRKKIGF